MQDGTELLIGIARELSLIADHACVREYQLAAGELHATGATNRQTAQIQGELAVVWNSIRNYCLALEAVVGQIEGLHVAGPDPPEERHEDHDPPCFGE